VLLNVTAFEGAVAADMLVARALRERGELFIGVRLDDDEIQRAIKMIEHGYREAAAYLAGARMWSRRPTP
jgi:hypothetical protein